MFGLSGIDKEIEVSKSKLFPGLILLAMVLNQVGLPVEGIALIIGVDRLLDMLRTVVNVTGDSTISTIVANSENQLERTNL